MGWWLLRTCVAPCFALLRGPLQWLFRGPILWAKFVGQPGQEVVLCGWLGCWLLCTCVVPCCALLRGPLQWTSFVGAAHCAQQQAGLVAAARVPHPCGHSCDRIRRAGSWVACSYDDGLKAHPNRLHNHSTKAWKWMCLVQAFKWMAHPCKVGQQCASPPWCKGSGIASLLTCLCERVEGFLLTQACAAHHACSQAPGSSWLGPCFCPSPIDDQLVNGQPNVREGVRLKGGASM